MKPAADGGGLRSALGVVAAVALAAAAAGRLGFAPRATAPAPVAVALAVPLSGSGELDLPGGARLLCRPGSLVAVVGAAEVRLEDGELEAPEGVRVLVDDLAVEVTSGRALVVRGGGVAALVTFERGRGRVLLAGGFLPLVEGERLEQQRVFGERRLTLVGPSTSVERAVSGRTVAPAPGK